MLIHTEKKTSPHISKLFFKLASVFKSKSHFSVHIKVSKVYLQTLLGNPVCLYGSQAEHYHLHNSEPTEN